MQRTEDEIVAEIKEVIDEIRYYISMDGGDLEFIEFDNITGIVTIKLAGACVGCHLVDTTYNEGVKEILVNEIEEVKDIKILE
ncbi:MAG: NifU family protein [Mycoplasmoidaceae bacterium]